MIVGINFHPEYTSTGKYTTELALAMRDRGHQVHVICPPPYYPDWRVWQGYSAIRYTREEYGGIQILRCPIWVPRRPSGGRRLLHLASFAGSSLLPLLFSGRHRPDWLLLVVPTVACAPAALLGARLAGARSWVHIQDLEVEAALGLRLLDGWSWLRRLLRGLEHGLLREFDRISAISEGMAQRLSEAGIDRERVELVPNWVDTDEIRSADDDAVQDLRRELDIASTCKVVLYAGNLGRKQDFDELLAAANRLRDREELVFLIVGEGAERGRLEREVQSRPNVQLRDPVPPTDLPALLSLATVHLLPQRAGVDTAVLPSKLGPIMASGRPVVATAQAGTELARVAAVGGVVVPPGDPEQLAAAIEHLAADETRQEQLGRQGRRYAQEHLSREQILDRALRSLR